MNLSNCRSKLLPAAVIAVSFLAGPVHGNQASVIEEVLVTAQKRTQSMQDVAIAPGVRVQ